MDISSNLSNSLETLKHKSYEESREWLDKSIKLGKYNTIFYFVHLNAFISKYNSRLGLEKYFYLEKYFNYALELKLLDISQNILNQIIKEFGREPKVKRLEAQLYEASSAEKYSNALNIYRNLIRSNQEDRASLKKYILLLKTISKNDDYVKLWNEYLKIYMDDADAWYELSEVYLATCNHSKAIYCLEEVLLHQPHNYMVYMRIGDIQASLNHVDAASNAIKYYSQSILIKPTPRAYWGILYCLRIIFKVGKTLDVKMKNLLKVTKIHLENFYSRSSFKLNLDLIYDLKLD